jgi:hypothetical protein
VENDMLPLVSGSFTLIIFTEISTAHQYSAPQGTAVKYKQIALCINDSQTAALGSSCSCQMVHVFCIQ